MIILEGPDGAGKTRLAHDLSRALSVPIAPKVVQSDMTSEVSVYDWTLQQMSEWPKKIIYDRFPLISEFIYGPIYNHDVRPGFFNLQNLWSILPQFLEADPVIVYCLPPWAEVWNNIQDEATDNSVVNDDRIKGVYARYLYEAARDDALVWDYTTTSYEGLLRHIKVRSHERNDIGY